MIELVEKINELVEALAKRNSPSSDFFKKAKNNLERDSTNVEELNTLIKCYAITQYANFSKKEEDILNQIINIARDTKKQVTGMP